MIGAFTISFILIALAFGLEVYDRWRQAKDKRLKFEQLRRQIEAEKNKKLLKEHGLDFDP